MLPLDAGAKIEAVPLLIMRTRLIIPALLASAAAGPGHLFVGDADSLVQRSVQRELHGDSGDCPLGYEVGHGDVGGWDQFGREMNNTHDNIRECAQDCSARPQCLSFEFSARTGICNLNKIAEPDTPFFEDYRFCKRTNLATDQKPAKEEGTGAEGNTQKALHWLPFDDKAKIGANEGMLAKASDQKYADDKAGMDGEAQRQAQRAVQAAIARDQKYADDKAGMDDEAQRQAQSAAQAAKASDQKYADDKAGIDDEAQRTALNQTHADGNSSRLAHWGKPDEQALKGAQHVDSGELAKDAKSQAQLAAEEGQRRKLEEKGWAAAENAELEIADHLAIDVSREMKEKVLEALNSSSKAEKRVDELTARGVAETVFASIDKILRHRKRDKLLSQIARQPNSASALSWSQKRLADGVTEPCPTGYRSLAGDEPGTDWFQHEPSRRTDTVELCGNACTERPSCGSFEWSRSSKECFLNKVTIPSSYRFKDFLFCQRKTQKFP